MLKMIKSYLMFTPFVYKLLAYVLLPLGLAGLFTLEEMGPMRDVGTLIVIGALILVQIVLDNWLFGGIQARHREQLDCLKTSGRGRRLLRDALIMDIVVRLLSALGIFGVCLLIHWLWRGDFYLWAGTSAAAALLYVYAVLTVNIMATLGVWVARFGDMMYYNVLAGYGAVFLGTLVWIFQGLWKNMVIGIVVIAMLDILVSYLAVGTAMKKMEKSYYDL